MGTQTELKLDRESNNSPLYHKLKTWFCTELHFKRLQMIKQCKICQAPDILLRKNLPICTRDRVQAEVLIQEWRDHSFKLSSSRTVFIRYNKSNRCMPNFYGNRGCDEYECILLLHLVFFCFKLFSSMLQKKGSSNNRWSVTSGGCALNMPK